MTIQNSARCAATAFLLVGMALGARADLKVISETSTRGVPKEARGNLPGESAPARITTYYKADRQRTEVGGQVTLFDGATGKLYTLNSERRTYTVVDSNAVADSLPASVLAMMDIKVQATVKPSTETKMLFGKTAKKYNYTAILSLSMKGVTVPEASLPTVTIEGENWNTEEFALNESLERLQRTNFLKRIPGVMGGSLRPLVEQLGNVKGLPLYSRVTVTIAGGVGAAAAGGIKDPIVSTTEVKEVSEASLPDSLFTIPEGYTEQAAGPKPLLP